MLSLRKCGCILRVPDQNGVSLLYIVLEIHHSGQEPSILYLSFGIVYGSWVEDCEDRHMFQLFFIVFCWIWKQVVKEASEFKSWAVEHKNRQQWGEAELSVLRRLNLRYFTPREVANLLCFPPEFGKLSQMYVHLNLQFGYVQIFSNLDYLWGCPINWVVCLFSWMAGFTAHRLNYISLGCYLLYL